MSRAFTKEDDGGAELLIVPRAPLPDGVPNYVTRRGLRLLQTEHADLERERALLDSSDSADRAKRVHAVAQRMAELQARLASAELVETHPLPGDGVRFGARVRVRRESGAESEYRIVGVDEADAGAGLLAF